MLLSKKISMISIVAILLFLMLSPFNVNARNGNLVTTTASSEEIVNVVILDAYYCDLDNDSYKDDIYAEVKLNLLGSNFYALDYYVNLTLPSGTLFSYYAKVNTNMNEVILKNFFYNHALESGDYTLTVKVVLKNGGMLTDSHSFVFDPPGGSDGADPSFDLV